MKRIKRAGFTLVEIMIVVAIIALLAAIAIPNVLRGRTSANEAAAIGNTRALVSSLEMFRSVNAVYPTTWAQMSGANPPFSPPSFAADLVAGTVVQGFTYTYVPDPLGPPNNTYTMTAIPTVFGRTGARAFFVDESGSLRHCAEAAQGEAADVNDTTIDAAPNAC